MSDPTIYYTVDLTGLVGASNGDGYVDRFTMPQYIAGGDPVPNVAVWTSQARANIRYDAVVDSLNTLGNIKVTTWQQVRNASPAGGLSMTVAVEHGASSLRTENESSPGNFLTGAAAIKRAVARPLVRSKTSNVLVKGVNIPVVAGALANSIANAEAAITVTVILTPDP